MLKIFDGIRDLTFTSMLIRVALAVLIGGLIGIERTRKGKTAGLRTHIYVSLGSSLAVMAGIYGMQSGLTADALRVAAQVVSGIGFLGAGIIILKDKEHVTGLTTAAGLWTTAIIGLACGIGFYEAAIICFLLSYCITKILPKFEVFLLKKHGKEENPTDSGDDKK